MNKKYTIVSQLVSAGLVATLFLYIKFTGAFFLRNAYYELPGSIIWMLVSVVVAYMIVELTVNRLKFSTGRKALILAVITIVPAIFLKFFL